MYIALPNVTEKYLKHKKKPNLVAFLIVFEHPRFGDFFFIP